MLDFYDQPPENPQTIHARLRPARDLLLSGIPFVVWGEDALSFVHYVPTGLFTFQLLVPDGCVQAAADHLLKMHPEYRVTNRRPFAYVGIPGEKPIVPSVIPNSVQLEWTGPLHSLTSDTTPREVLIIAQSHLNFDVRDSTRTRGLIPPFDVSDSQIRFPTQGAYFDALIDGIYEWRSGTPKFHYWFNVEHCCIHLSYLVMYNVRVDEDEDPLDPDRELLDVEKEMLAGVAARTRPYLEAYMRRAIPAPTLEMVAERERLIRDFESRVGSIHLHEKEHIMKFKDTSKSQERRADVLITAQKPHRRSFSTLRAHLWPPRAQAVGYSLSSRRLVYNLSVLKRCLRL